MPQKLNQNVINDIKEYVAATAHDVDADFERSLEVAELYTKAHEKTRESLDDLIRLMFGKTLAEWLQPYE